MLRTTYRLSRSRTDDRWSGRPVGWSPVDAKPLDGLTTIDGVSEDPQPSFDPGKLRASDADREGVARVLQTAMAEGRLTVAELQERLDTVYKAKTLSELEPVTWDLPGHQELVPRVPTTPQRLIKTPTTPASSSAMAKIGGIPSSTVAGGILSGATRAGQWVVPTQFTALAIMGGVDIDLTQARFAEAEVTITAVAIMGGIDIVVPDDITVIVSGIGFMGAFEDSAHVQGPPGAPIVRVNGIALMAGVEVHRPKKKGKGQIEQ